MKKEFRLLCALGMATMHTVAMANQSSYQDRQMASSDGRQWVERTVRLSDFEGGDVAVQVRLFKDGKGGSVYRYDDQNEITKLHHRRATIGLRFCRTYSCRWAENLWLQWSRVALASPAHWPSPMAEAGALP